MKLLLLSLFICLMLPAYAGTTLAHCAGIESSVARLDCYDALAREQAEDEPMAEADQPKPQPPLKHRSKPRQTPARSALVRPPPAKDDVDVKREVPELDPVERFGKETDGQTAADLDHIEARIETVRKTSLGRHVMTLSNGQIWMENEPGRRRIRPDQAVTIRKVRWHYEMELTSQPDVAVHRVE